MEIPDDSEFKGDGIDLKQYRYGFSHMEKKYVQLYSEFFSILNQSKGLLVQITLINKFQIVIMSMLKSLQENKMNEQLLYSIIKFYNINKDEELLKMIFAEDTSIKEIANKMEEIATKVADKEKII